MEDRKTGQGYSEHACYDRIKLEIPETKPFKKFTKSIIEHKGRTMVPS